MKRPSEINQRSPIVDSEHLEDSKADIKQKELYAESKADIKQKELYGSAFGERSCTMEKPFPAVNR